MIVAEDGTVVYPSGSVSRATSSQSGQVSIVASSATNHVHVGYGPETWWAGLLNGLTVPHATSETTKKGPPESSYKQSIQELRISVFIPGGYVQLADFDAFFAMVVPYLQRLSTLETLIFDMVFDVQISTGGSSYYGYSRNGQRVLRDHFERQQAYVARLIDPHAPILPLVPLPDKPEMIHQRSEPYHTRPTSRMPRGITPTRAGTADSSFARIVPTSPGHIPVLTAGESSAETTRVGSPVQPTAAIPTRAIPLAKTLRHVYFGEYHGIPPLPPPDSIPVANGVMSYEHEHVGGSIEGGEGESTSPPLGDPGKSSSVSPGRTNAPKESGRKKKALLGGGVVGGVSPVGAAVGASITQGFGAGRTYLVRSGEREGSDEGASVDNNNQRSVPGMWWTVVREDSNAHEEPMQVDGPSMRSSSFSSAKESRRVIQGWEEVEDTSYVNSKLTDTMAIPGKGGVKEEEEITPPA
ncbi:hypothetical protein M408DRAFT_332364 [Serendipita vermifera MAFF 305830]|uniref:Uncharacterized protein n=1 Tax=Serendipita vermifera MAFF 305830 TaxID=933852 RepID=A0A0C2WAJ2_SERVB|nr:hypothetical protein M408DRAFT_332364 [Serendipita vermifera MAFF 305830]